MGVCPHANFQIAGRLSLSHNSQLRLPLKWAVCPYLFRVIFLDNPKNKKLYRADGSLGARFQKYLLLAPPTLWHPFAVAH